MCHTEELVSITGVRTMFEKAITYMIRSLAERQSHLVLSEPCIEIGGGSKDFRGLLAHFLRTHIMTRRDGANLCHACHNDACSNPRHLYWGTYAENYNDMMIFRGKKRRPPKTKVSKEDHAAHISAAIKKKYQDDPEFLAAQRDRMRAAAKQRKYLRLVS